MSRPPITGYFVTMNHCPAEWDEYSDGTRRFWYGEHATVFASRREANRCTQESLRSDGLSPYRYHVYRLRAARGSG